MASRTKTKANLNPGVKVLAEAYQDLSLQLTRIQKIQSHSFPLSNQFPNDIHDLRVATRKAQATLKLFQKRLDPIAFKKVWSILRQIRNRAGLARNWHIFTTHCQNSTFLNNHPFFQGILLGTGITQKTLEQNKLHSKWSRQAPKARKLFDRILQSMKKIKDVQQIKISTRIQRRFALPLDRKIQAGKLEIKTLHEIRIRIKKLRYGLKLLNIREKAKLLKDLLSHLAYLQETIGDITDQQIIINKLLTIRKGFSKTDPDTWKAIKGRMQEHLKKQEQKLLQKVLVFKKWLPKTWNPDKT